jgi:hypothetical protein
MWEWSEHLKLGKSSAFVKRDLKALPLTEAEFEADFFFDARFSTKRRETWTGLVVDREFGGLPAMEEVRMPPPTVNHLATLLAHAMARPPNYEDRQRPGILYLRDRPQWHELVPHLEQLGIKVVLGDDLPWFDAAVMDWLHDTEGATSFTEALIASMGTRKKPAKKMSVPEEVKVSLRRPFPERKRTWFDTAMTLMEWTNEMGKGAYPRRNVPEPAYEPTTVVSVPMPADELETILTMPNIAKTKKLRPRLEAMRGSGRLDLPVDDWVTVCLALGGGGRMEVRDRQRSLGIVARIANELAETLQIDPPVLRQPGTRKGRSKQEDG